jgi:DNA-binding transcriptional LysR family regulator
MDFRHIRAFIAVAEALSITRAAERLHISQPPLSRHIHQLERELGVTLFARHRHGVALTPEGRRLLDKARALERSASDFYEAAREAALAPGLTFRVGIGWGLWDVVNRVRVEFAKRRPDATIEASDAFCYYDSDEQLKNRQLDVAFARPPFDPSFRVSEPLYHERIQAVVSDASDLAALDEISIGDLGREPLLMWDRHVAPTLYDRILELYTRARVTPRIVPTPGAGPFNHAGMMLVASGKGVYLGYGVPLTGPQPAGGVAVRPISDPAATIEVCVVTRKNDRSPHVHQFLECVAAVFPQDTPVAAVAGG